MDIKCFLLENTGRMSPFIDGVSCPVYIRKDTGEEVFGKEAYQVGAMWFGDKEFYEHYPTGPDGRTLFVETPGGTWCVDSEASNCTRKGDKEHKCWVRHGEAPNITVDKNGNTCSAGAGSIGMGSYHGFLQNGYLTNA